MCCDLLLSQDKTSRIERIVGEHRLFSQGLKELQDWVCEAQRVLSSCNSTTTDKGVLEERMLQLEVRREINGWGITSENAVEVEVSRGELKIAVR